MTQFIRTVPFILATGTVSAQSLQIVPIDLFVNGHPQGNIECRIAGISISIEKSKLVESLRPFLDAQGIASLESTITDYVDVSVLRNFGIVVKYTPSTLQLDLTVSPERSGLLVLKAGASPPQSNLVIEKPADFSAYLNIRTLAGLQTSSAMTTVPFQFVLQPVINYQGWVLDVSETSASGLDFSLDYARVSHDFVANNQRLTFGSLFLPITGFMSSQPLYGVEFFEDPKMTENLHDLYLIKQQFLLSQAATVSVLLNKSNIGAYHLDPGKYVIPNIFFGNGLNNLVIKSDNVILQTTIPYDSRLLIENEMAYSASLGMPQWEFASPILSGFFLYGLTPYLTTGVFTQDGLGNQMAGIETTYATLVGNFHGQLGISGGPAVDFAAELDYQLAFGYGTYYPVINLTTQYTGKSFVLPGLIENQYSWLFSASYSQPLPYEFSLGLALSYQVGWEPNPSQLSARATVSHPVGSDVNINLVASATEQVGSPVQMQIMIMLSAILNNGKESAFATFSGQAASADFRYQPSLLLPYGTFSISKDGDVISGSASAQYTTQFVDTSLSDSFSPSVNTLLLSAGIALVTAGGAFGITQPISDSFALIVPKDNMLGQTIYANKTSDSYDGVVTDEINVGLSQLPSYTRSLVSLTSSTAPVDSDMGPSIRIFSPTYKSGTVIVVGTKATIFVSGKLTFDGEAYSYHTGKLASSDRSESFFTDEDGSFQIYGLTPGVWTLTIDGTDLKQVITIPNTASKQYEVGTVALEAPK